MTMMSPSLAPLDPTSVLVGGGVVVLCVLWWLSTRRPPGLPPGPGPALPLLGHLHLLAKDPRPQLWAWRRQYGEVFSLSMGGRLVVVLASYSAIREALVTFADAFSDRPRGFLIDQVIRNKGIVGSSGSTWREQRKTAVEVLRAMGMGMGRNILAERIQEEITHFIQAIRGHQGAAVDLARMTQVSVSNNMCSILLGKRFDYTDPELIEHLQRMDENFHLVPGTAILNYLPVLGYLPGDLLKKRKVLANVEALFAFTEKHVAAHRNTLQEAGGEVGGLEDSDFIFSYLRQIQDRKKRGVVDTTLCGESLLNTVSDLFIAGAEATSTALHWALLFFLHYPHVQTKCFQEISEVVGHHRPPSMRDKAQLTYLEATVCEVLRKGDAAPLAAVHATSSDVMFRGYVIPKGTDVIPDLNCVLQDPEIWGDPENFRPERFIGLDGKLTKPEEFIPFGEGGRLCVGESIVRMELFLYLATLIQHFRFLPTDEGQLPSLEGEFGGTYTPQPYTIRAVSRV